MTTDIGFAPDTATGIAAGDTLADATVQAVAETPDGTPATPAGEQNPNAESTQVDAPVVPEAYEFVMPDGVELDGAAADEFSALAKELKLSQADAQRVADVAVKMQQKQAETHATTVKGWADSCKTDKEFGGDNLEQSMTVARKAIDSFGSPELKALLNTSGLGNHPEVVRFAFKAGKAISEDGFVRSGSRVPTPELSLEKRLYPNMN